MAIQVTEPILRSARIIWEYHQLRHKPIPADVIVALGTNDLRVAAVAARLLHEGYGERIVFTGGIAHQGDLLATPWPKTEAEMFADIAIAQGVAADRILLETRATNTSENLRFSRDLLAEHGLRPDNIVLVTKPFMQRRTWATMAVVWPEMPATLASECMSLDEYFTPELAPEKIIHIMMGDLQRIWIYGRRGWSAPQIVPIEVLRAYEHLKASGFTRHLLADEGV